jgi:hypothetical protein
MQHRSLCRQIGLGAAKTAVDKTSLGTARLLLKTICPDEAQAMGQTSPGTVEAAEKTQTSPAARNSSGCIAMNAVDSTKWSVEQICP